MIGGRLWFPAPMLWSVGFLFTFLFGGITGVLLASAAARLPVPGHVLRRRAPPQRARRRLDLRDVGRDHVLVPEDHRPAAQRGPGEGPLLAVGRSGSCSPSCPSTSWARGACRAATRTTRPKPGWAELNLLSTVGSFLHRAVGGRVLRGGRRGAAPAARCRAGPVGGQLARVVGRLAAAAPQLPVAAADPLGAPGVRRPVAAREATRAAAQDAGGTRPAGNAP